MQKKEKNSCRKKFKSTEKKDPWLLWACRRATGTSVFVIWFPENAQNPLPCNNISFEKNKIFYHLLLTWCEFNRCPKLPARLSGSALIAVGNRRALRFPRDTNGVRVLCAQDSGGGLCHLTVGSGRGRSWLCRGCICELCSKTGRAAGPTRDNRRLSLAVDLWMCLP